MIFNKCNKKLLIWIIEKLLGSCAIIVLLDVNTYYDIVDCPSVLNSKYFISQTYQNIIIPLWIVIVSLTIPQLVTCIVVKFVKINEKLSELFITSMFILLGGEYILCCVLFYTWLIYDRFSGKKKHMPSKEEAKVNDNQLFGMPDSMNVNPLAKEEM